MPGLELLAQIRIKVCQSKFFDFFNNKKFNLKLVSAIF